MGGLRFTIIIMRNIFFYIVAGVFMLLILAPIGNICALISPKKRSTDLLIFGGTGLRRILEFCIGVKVEYRGLENLIKGPCIIASKHQAAYETFMLFNSFYNRAVYVLKAEIARVYPYLALMYKNYEGGIKIKRQDGVKALIKMEQEALRILKEGRQFVIFPEGTRIAFGETAPFKRGVERVYAKANVPVIPVALNTGSIMPRNSFLNYPGKIIIEFLPPIASGLDKEVFMQTLKLQIDHATKKLEQETPCNYYLKKQKFC